MSRSSVAKGMRRTLQGGLVAVALLAAQSVSAEALTPLRETALPRLDQRAELATIDRSLVAFPRGGGALRLAPGARAWTPAPWRDGAAPVGTVAGSFGDGAQAFVARQADAAQAGVAGTATDPGAATATERATDTATGTDATTTTTTTTQATTISIERIDLDGDALVRHPLPTLPAPLSRVQGAVRDGVVHVSGVGTDGATHLFRIDTTVADPSWTSVAPWPGGGAALSLAAPSTGIVAVLENAAGTQALWSWNGDAGWRARGAVPGRVLSGSGRAIGQAHVLYLVESADKRVLPMTFQSITSGWATLPGATVAQPVAWAPWPEGFAWATPSGDGMAVTTAQVQARKLLLTWLDWIVIVVYLAAMIGIGLYFYLREKRTSTDSFFVGNRTIPFWAAGLSLYAVNTSSISFIAIPAKAFETNWQYLTNNLIAVLGLVFVAIWIVPLLRRLDLTSTFSYLETRFHPAIRMMASALAILMQIGSRMSVILFLPALAISTITGIDVVWSIWMMGGFTIVYTAMGGMKAVIWTDVVQVIVKMGGAIFAIGFIVWSLKGGAGEFVATAMAEDKTRLFDFSFDLTKATVWGFIFLVLFEVVLTFPKDQVLMQRVLSTKSDRDAGRSIWAFAAIMIPGGFVFYGIGTALFVYYKNHPERMNPLLPIDATFPLFIAAELPMGVTGLIIAGIFAAAMATLSGIMNSVATLISVDFYDKFAKNKTARKSVFFAEMMTVVVGLVGIGAALLLSRFDIHSLFDVSIELAGLLGGGFAGAYTLGMFTKRANSPGVAIGIAAAIVLTTIAWSFSLVHPYFYLAISILVCIVVGYLASLCFPAPARSLDGLTIYRDAA